MINIEEFTFLSSDGQTRLHAMLWLPEGEIRGILQIAHGVAEHVARYDGFARYLCARGIAVAGHDHLGHGKSLPDGATPVYFGAQDGWQHAVDDIHALHQRLQEEFPNMPLCIMGHSMGSFLTRSYQMCIRDRLEVVLRVAAAVAEHMGDHLVAGGSLHAHDGGDLRRVLGAGGSAGRCV